VTTRKKRVAAFCAVFCAVAALVVAALQTLRYVPGVVRPDADARMEPLAAELPAALSLARDQLAAFRSTGDVRPLARAQAALSPWLNGPKRSLEALLLSANAAQLLNQFEAALAYLDRARVQAPRDARVWLTRATVLLASGRYAEARASCRALMPLASPSVVAACVAPIDGLTGRYEVAHHGLEQALQMAGSLEQQAWLFSLQGELAFWAGELERAERALGTTLALDPQDRDARALHADLLLDAGRAQEALSLLSGREGDDAMLLRIALAYHRLGLPQARTARARLEQRFAAARARGEFVQQREEARLLSGLAGQAQRALRAAQAAFDARQEPWDARLLLEAALSAGEPAAARPALDWLARTGFEAPLLRRLAEQLAALR
jgi:tetratricopeptide (TPR) repeat protein